MGVGAVLLPGVVTGVLLDSLVAELSELAADVFFGFFGVRFVCNTVI